MTADFNFSGLKSGDFEIPRFETGATERALRLLASDFLSMLSENTNQSNRTTYRYNKKIYSTTETQEKNTVKIIVQQQEKKKKVHRTV